MGWLLLALYLIGIPLNVLVVAYFRIDPLDDSLYEQHHEASLAGWSVFWPLLWFIFMVCWIIGGYLRIVQHLRHKAACERDRK